MTEALSTTAVYTITAETPTYCEGAWQTSARTGDRVKIANGWDGMPDGEGDVFVKRESDRNGFWIAAKDLTKEATVADFPVGTRVRVAADAKTHNGHAVYFGDQVDGYVIAPLDGYTNDLNVKADRRDLSVRTQIVGPAYLTKIEEPEAAAEESPTESGEELVVDGAIEGVIVEPVEVVSVAAVQKAHAFLIDKGDSESTEALIELAKLIEAGV